MKIERRIWIETCLVVLGTTSCCLALWWLLYATLSTKVEIEIQNRMETSQFNIEEMAALVADNRMVLLDSYGVNEIAAEIRESKMAANQFELSDYERWVVESIVAGESGNQPIEGMMAVAQCLRNACVQDGLQPSEVRTVYQYSGWAPNFENDNPERYAMVQEVVIRVFDNGESVTDANILWFYAPRYSAGSFHNTQCFVMEIGDHLFFEPWT